MIAKIKEELKDDKERIISILEKINCINIHTLNDKEIRFGTDDKGSGSGNKLSLQTLNYISFSKNINGDIITLVSDMLKISIKDSIRWLANELGIKSNYKNIFIKRPFGNFWSKYDKYKIDNSPPLSYSEDLLSKFSSQSSLLWIKDGISALTQEYFGIGYDVITDRIIVPYYSEEGNLCGVVGRLNKKDIEIWQSKYLALVPIDKSKILYGLYQNYKSILDKQVLIIVEAEKSVMKGKEIDIPCVSLGKHSISPRQANLIKSTFVKNIIITFDEDIPFEECKKEADKIKIKNPFFSNNIYIVNMNNPYIEKGSKVSLLDLDKEIINKILNEYLVEVIG